MTSFLNLPPEEALPRYHQIAAFTLRDQYGELVEASTLRGKISVVGFFFSRCPMVCPRLRGQLAQLQASTTTNYQTILITTDPAHDTPERLNAYAIATETPDNWRFLTGQPEQIAHLAEVGLHLSADAFPNGHSDQVVLIDQQGVIRGWYHLATAEHRTMLVQAIQTLNQ